MAFGLGLVCHLRQRTQALSHFIALQTGRFVGTGIAQGHGADFHASTLGHIPGLTYDRLQFIHKAIDRRGHVADFILAVDLHALGEVALARRQVIHGRNQQLQAIDHSAPQHDSDQQQYAEPHQCEPHADTPAQGAGGLLYSAGGVGSHLGRGSLRRLQACAHG